MENLLEALKIILTFKVIGMMLIGITAGIIAGALPGLTATMTIALLVPFTYQIDPPIAALMVLLGVYVGAMHGGDISAILISTPGTPAAAATCLDGYPMAQNGQAALALNIAALTSSIGTVFGAAVLWTVAQPIANIALKFGPFEMFCLTVFGISIIASLSEKNIAKGFIMGALGMLFSTVGRSAVFDMDRLTLGYTGFPESDLRYIPLMIGVFAIAEALTQIEDNLKIKKADTSFKNAFPTLKQWKEMIPAISIGSIVGTLIGAIPGTGGDIASYVAYDQTRKFSKHKDKFGKGYAPGVAAPQAANNAVCGGAMIPMLTLGIPGDSVTAILIGAMIIIGLRPGPTLFTSPDPAMHVMVTSIFVGLMVVAILVTPVRLIGVPLFAKTVTLARQYLWPLVTVFCIVGSFAMTGSMVSVYIMLAFGFFGYFMKKFGFPSGPMIIGVILGPLAESSLHRALRISHGDLLPMFSPLAIILICFSLFSVSIPLIQRMKKDKGTHTSAGGNI